MATSAGNTVKDFKVRKAKSVVRRNKGKAYTTGLLSKVTDFNMHHHDQICLGKV